LLYGGEAMSSTAMGEWTFEDEHRPLINRIKKLEERIQALEQRIEPPIKKTI
jgi:uncharacterized protein (UPF0335 family)